MAAALRKRRRADGGASCCANEGARRGPSIVLRIVGKYHNNYAEGEALACACHQLRLHHTTYQSCREGEARMVMHPQREFALGCTELAVGYCKVARCVYHHCITSGACSTSRPLHIQLFFGHEY